MIRKHTTSATEGGSPHSVAADTVGRPYWRLWWANSIDNLGDGIWRTAVPLLAAVLTRDPRLVAAVSAATFLPWLVLSLPIGALVDSRDRIRLMSISQWFQGAVAALVTLAVATHIANIAVLCVGGFLIGCADVVVVNAAQSVLPELVPDNLLVAANSRQTASQTITSSFIGPPVGSLLFAAVAWLSFGLNAVSFAVSAALLLRLRRQGPSAPAIQRSANRMRTDIAGGLRWLLHHRLLRVVAGVFAVNCLTNQIAMSTLVLVALQHFHFTQTGYGLLGVCMACGSLLANLLIRPLVQRVGTIRATLIAVGVNAVAYIGVGLSPNIPTFVMLLAVASGCTAVWNVTTVTMRQKIVPRGLLGRVNSVYRMLGWGLMPIGSLLGGIFAHTFGLTTPFLIAGALRGLAVLAGLPLLLAAARRGEG